MKDNKQFTDEITKFLEAIDLSLKLLNRASSPFPHEIHRRISDMLKFSARIYRQNVNVLREIEPLVGRVVKLVKPKEFKIGIGLPVINDQYRLEYELAPKIRNAYYESSDICRFIAPKDTLVVISGHHVTKWTYTYRLAVSNPVTKVTGRYGVFDASTDDFTFNVTDAEKESMSESRAKLILTRSKNNLEAIKKIGALD